MKDQKTDDAYETWLSKYGGYAKDMPLRDYFAAKAMEGFLSAPDTGWLEEEIAEQAYKMADRMLAARVK